VQAKRLSLLREDPSTAPTERGVLVIDETGDRKDGHQTAHVSRQYLANLGKIDNGVVSVSSLWADERVYYPVDFEPYTPAVSFAKGKDDPQFRTKLKIALQLVERALHEEIPFRAVVADSLYGEDRGFRRGLRELKQPYVLALKPSHAWYHPEEVAGTLQDVAHEAGWVSTEQSGKWVRITRTFRDGSTQEWWAVEIMAGPYGPDKQERAFVATTDPENLPDLSTWYLVTNLPAPLERAGTELPLPAASLEEVVRLYGLRMWVEQSYKQVKHALGWSQYQVRSDQAIRRHWQLVWCAFSFCWYHASHPSALASEEAREPFEPETPPAITVAGGAVGSGEKNQGGKRKASTGVLASSATSGARLVGTLDHAASRYWSGWSPLPPPPAVQLLLHRLERGQPISLYSSA
jgi:SRSO17 transposase